MHKKTICFLIPYYNHPRKIIQLVEYLSVYEYSILIIDDGSNQEAKQVLSHISSPLVTVYTREKNGGKGAAVKTGFEKAKEMGFWSCFQIDADMQHDLSKIPQFLDEWKKNPDAIICANPQYSQDVPKARLYGRKITDFWVWVNTMGGGLKDVMCGMRIYPIVKMQNAIKKTHSNRMDFDIEILLYAFREQLSFIWIDVGVIYDKTNISHFATFKDNWMISKIHTKHFFAIPFALMDRRKNKEMWWEMEEKGSMAWLKITLMCVAYLPYPLLRILIAMITGIYYLCSKKERKNLCIFHQNLQAYFSDTDFSKLKPYQHFYAFGECICDKFAVWFKKISYQDLLFGNEVQKDIAFSQSRGQIVLVSHFGNIEIARAMERREGRESRMNILVHSKNAKKFNEVINQISGVQLGIFEVENLGVKEMMELKACIDRGENIGIMGDRISLNPNQSKNIEVDFFGKKCLFPSGAFLLAGILDCPIGLLWCEKKNGKYLITYEGLAEKIVLGRDKERSIRPFLERYIHSYEQRIKNNPTQWFNFFNIWEQGQ